MRWAFGAEGASLLAALLMVWARAKALESSCGDVAWLMGPAPALAKWEALADAQVSLVPRALARSRLACAFVTCGIVSYPPLKCEELPVLITSAPL